MNNRRFYNKPNDMETKIAAAASQILANYSNTEETVILQIVDNKIHITVPSIVIRMLAEILDQMASGNAISIGPIPDELSTTEAAHILKVSRPYCSGQVNLATI